MPTDFIKLGIHSKLIEILQKDGIVSPTPIQEQSIPVLLKGADLIGKAQTGTGKTLAFLLPIFEKIDTSQPHVQALIITPTRELAIQIAAEAKKLAAEVGANVLAAYGGQDVERQLKKLKGSTHLVVGTPGRLLDHLRRGTVDFSNLTFLVLDEADQMLTMGFLPDVEQIIFQTSPQRQTMLFSATMPSAIRTLAARYLRNPVEIEIKSNQVTLDEIKQVIVEVTDRGKQDALFKMLDENNPYLAIVFCRTKRRASTLNEALLEKGYASDELHGDLSQAKREQVMRRFRDAKIHILVATDVASRGLDVEGISHIYNYDIPHDLESYIHRIGRTGRAGLTGTAITFVSSHDREFLSLIERGINSSIEKRNTEGQIITTTRRRAEPAGRNERESKARTKGYAKRGNDVEDGGRRSRGRSTEGDTPRGRSRGGSSVRDAAEGRARSGNAADKRSEVSSARGRRIPDTSAESRSGIITGTSRPGYRSAGSKGIADSTARGRNGGAAGTARERSYTARPKKDGAEFATARAGGAGARNRADSGPIGRNSADQRSAATETRGMRGAKGKRSQTSTSGGTKIPRGPSTSKSAPKSPWRG